MMDVATSRSITDEELKARTRLIFKAIGGVGEPDFIVIPGPPPTKARVRFQRGGKSFAYQSAGDRNAEERTAVYIRQKMQRKRDGNLSVVCVFVRPNRHRIDSDNMLKHVLDAGTRSGTVWHDDCQVTGVCGIVEYDTRNPRTIIAIGAHESTMDRRLVPMANCLICKKTMPKHAGTRDRPQYCGPDCARTARGYSEDLTVPFECGHCRMPFRRRTSGQMFCSQRCRIQSLTGHNKQAAHGNTCTDCGTRLAKSTAQRCRTCWRVSIAAKPTASPITVESAT